MSTCDDTRQLTQQERDDGAAAARQTGVVRALRPYTGPSDLDALLDYMNRELVPAVQASRGKVNEVHQQVARNAPSANPLGYYFSTDTTNADPTTGRIRLDSATQNAATIIRVSEMNAQLQSVLPWLEVMAGGITFPIGTITLMDAVNPARYFRGNLLATIDQGAYWDLQIDIFESSSANPFVDGEGVLLSFLPAAAKDGVMLKGAVGPSPGADGRDGEDGFPGPPGLPGRDGGPGLPGGPGIDGSDGAEGFPGIPGFPGMAGAQGFPGNPGMDGMPGEEGIPGAPGLRGPAGADGFPTSKIAAWLRLARATQSAGGWSSVPDILASNPATANAAREPAVASTANGFPIATFATNDCLSWPLTNANNNLFVRGYAFWARPSGTATQNTVLCVFTGTGGASAVQLSVHFIGQTLQVLIASSGSNGRLGTTGSIFVPNAWAWVVVSYDSSQPTEATKLTVTVGGVAQTLTFSNFGAGGTIGVLVAATGNALIGNINDGTASFPYNGDLGSNLWVLSAALTTIEDAALSAFEEPTTLATLVGLPGSIGNDGADGADGLPGFPGQPGNDGQPGAFGFPGQPGNDGDIGPIGEMGMPGPQGTQGNNGNDGLPGPMGVGIDGQDGAEGVMGVPGQPGTQGTQGIPGFHGWPGNDGVDGGDGSAGFPGQQGIQGPAGSNGFNGPPGADGQDAASVLEGMMGPPGSPFGTPSGFAPALSVFANATNAVATPAFLQGSSLYRYLRTNVTGTVLEFGSPSVHAGSGLTYNVISQQFDLANMAAATLKGNRTSSSAAPTDVLIAALAGTNLDYDAANIRLILQQRSALSVMGNPTSSLADAQDILSSGGYQYLRTADDGNPIEWGPAPIVDWNQYQLRDDFTFFLFDAADGVLWADTPWTGSFTGAGAPTGMETAPAAPGTYPGEMVITTGTTSNGGYTIYKGISVNQKLFLCSSVKEFMWIVRLDTVTNVVVQCGLGDNGINTATNGAGFFYSAAGSASTWQCYAIAASSSATSTIGGTVTAGNYYRLRAVRNIAGSWTFTVNELNATTLTKDPSALVNFYNHIHTTDTTSKRLFTDYCHLLMGPLR